MYSNILILKHFFYRHSKSSCNPEGKSERRYIFPRLERYDGLAGNTYTVGKLFLCHFIVIETKPPYFIFGGLVFTVLSTDLVHSWGQRWWEKAPADLIYYAIGAGRLNESVQKEIVVLLSVLPDNVNIGYHGIGKDIVKKINGRDIKSFKDFVLQVNETKKSVDNSAFNTFNPSSCHRSQASTFSGS